MPFISHRSAVDPKFAPWHSPCSPQRPRRSKRPAHVPAINPKVPPLIDVVNVGPIRDLESPALDGWLLDQIRVEPIAPKADGRVLQDTAIVIDQVDMAR